MAASYSMPGYHGEGDRFLFIFLQIILNYLELEKTSKRYPSAMSDVEIICKREAEGDDLPRQLPALSLNPKNNNKIFSTSTQTVKTPGEARLTGM